MANVLLLWVSLGFSLPSGNVVCEILMLKLTLLHTVRGGKCSKNEKKWGENLGDSR